MNSWGYLKALCLFVVSLFLINLSAFAKSTSNMTLTKVTFKELPGWHDDNLENALHAFKQSCREIMERTDDKQNPSILSLSSFRKWRDVCLKAAKLYQPDEVQTRQFFETWFVPYEVADEGNREGLFTGYYLPLIHARLRSTKQFSIPIYALPDDLVKVDLSLFQPRLAGTTIVAQVKNNTLNPYPDRQAINRDKLDAARILLWADDPIDVYFAHVQGSAIVELSGGKRVLIGYAGDNGRKYTAIGKVLVTNHELASHEVSMQSIRAWLASHPNQVDSLFNQNASYVFFKILPDYHPLGTEKVPLTPERSLAIDNSYIPFGAPIWLSTTIPDATHQTSESKNFRRLLIAQDTGGAIKGVIRGDIYWGAGSKAAFIAGHMKNPGRYWLLVPR